MDTQKYDCLLQPGRLFAVLFVVLILSGCAELTRRFPDLFPQETTVVAVEKPAPVVNVPEPDFTHVVTWHGESLSVISAWYTGQVSNWRAIAAANPQLDPDRIYLGDTVIIPRELLITRKALPEAFVSRFTGHPKPSGDIDKGTDQSPSTGPAVKNGPESAETGSPVGADIKKNTGDEDVESGAAAPAAGDSGESGEDTDAFKLFGPKE